MPLKIIGGSVNGTIDAPADADILLDGVALSAAETAIRLRSTDTIYTYLQLSDGAPKEAVIAALKAAMDDGQVGAQREIDRSRLTNWLSAGADATSLVQAVWALSTGPYAQALLRMLSGP